MGYRYRLLASRVVFVAIFALALCALPSCLDPGVEISDVTARYVNLEKRGFDYELKRDFALLKGRSFISGRLLLPSELMEEFLKEEALYFPIFEKPVFERTLHAGSKFKISKIKRFFDEWEDQVDEDASYAIVVELEGGELCMLEEGLYKVDKKSMEFKDEYIAKSSN